MNLSIRNKLILTVSLGTALPILFILTLVFLNRGKLEEDLTGEVERLVKTNISQIVVDVASICQTTHDLIQEQLTGNLNVARRVLKDYGKMTFSAQRVEWQAQNQFTKEIENISLPLVKVGQLSLAANADPGLRTPIVDDIVDLVGGTVTIFQKMNTAGDMLRVATNVIGNNQKRAISTFIPAVNPDGAQNPVIAAVMRGQTFRGKAYVVNQWYQTAYEPIYDQENEIVGILYVGIPQNAVESLRNSIMETKVGNTGYVFVLGGNGSQKGHYIISKDGLRDGEDILNAKDADGRLFIQSMISKATSAKEKEVSFERYPWKNKGESESRNKIAALYYFEPWDWVIGAGAYESDFFVARENLLTAITGILNQVTLGGAFLMLVIILIGVALARRIIRPVQDMAAVADRLSQGDFEQEVGYYSQDETGQLANAFRSIITFLKERTDIADALSRGDYNVEVSVLGKQDKLGRSMARLKDRFADLTDSLKSVIQEQHSGKLSARCEVPQQIQGTFREILSGINDVLESITKPFNEVGTLITAYAGGDLSSDMRQLPGEQAQLTRAMEVIKNNLSILIEESRILSEAASAGNLQARGDVDRLQGRYRDIIEGMNHTFENLTTPVNEALQCLSDMSRGKLTTAMKGNYLGDFEKLKSAVNSTSRAMNELLVEVLIASEQVNAGARQISDSSQALSTGATEQASSLQEISASMDQVAEQTRMNASNAKAANQLSNTAAQFAGSGNDQMRRMLGAMEEINQASNAISQIIKSIDEIAFQTNLLALNAAVEAARAGIHGKGFAVVAEEVRNLAQRSAKAAKETTQLIENTVQRVSNGQDIAKMTAESLDKIVVEVEKVKNLVGDITHASESQSEGIHQISIGLTQIDKVTQSNTATAEETASASQELSSQASLLEEKLSQFELSGKGYTDAPKAVARPVKRTMKAPEAPVANMDDGIFIDLEDSDFADF
ncbi:MAG TPA: Cache 3/Cache 2 fusion domain-containing protein [Calditrichia bacterium]|nr:Cache 3/Cache 2 fusion domain-containing protein [Calditrichia bacterium]